MNPAEVVELVNGVFTPLAPAVRPLALDLLLQYTEDDFPYTDRQRVPNEPRWHLRRVPNPVDLTIESNLSPVVQVHVAGPLDSTTVADWLTRALNQPLPGRVAAISRIWMTFAEVRLDCPEFTSRNTLAVHDGPDVDELPLDVRDDGYWLAAPNSVLENPAIGLELYQDAEMLGLQFTVSLSPWITKGSAEYELFRTCLRSLLQTWELDGPDPVFELDRL